MSRVGRHVYWIKPRGPPASVGQNPVKSKHVGAAQMAQLVILTDIAKSIMIEWKQRLV